MDENISDIIERIKSIEGFADDTQVAKILGMSKQNLQNYKSEGRIPRKKIKKYCEERSYSVYFILTGEGQLSKSLEGVQNAFIGNDAADNLNELIGLAGAVLGSGTIYADALAQNIRAFYHGWTNERDGGGSKKIDKPGEENPGGGKRAVKASG
jgi:hypothetical protein